MCSVTSTKEKGLLKRNEVLRYCFIATCNFLLFEILFRWVKYQLFLQTLFSFFSTKMYKICLIFVKFKCILDIKDFSGGGKKSSFNLSLFFCSVFLLIYPKRKRHFVFLCLVIVVRDSGFNLLWNWNFVIYFCYYNLACISYLSLHFKFLSSIRRICVCLSKKNGKGHKRTKKYSLYFVYLF